MLLQMIIDVPTVGGRLMLVDMAGSENIEQAGQTGMEAKMQTAKINQGNSALKRVVESNANGDSHVPFRDTKLTMLLQDQVKSLKLAAAQSEMTNKENLGKQYAKVPEEDVSGWEKAESEAATLKNNLESVTLLKLTAEDSASHLDGALKKCMRQIDQVKCMRQIEVANKQHLEGVKKIAKLEAERRRLHGLVWNKLLRPIALAQMKLDLTTQTYDLEIAKLDAERQRLHGLVWKKLLQP
ncbi:hypothetical protein CQW23_34190 [Capsicum baccatum]|uniref:Kinesin motor domain-containing protein n=1 Tax=Capsicum baccatum TaxID=33114 RepID=A0A2G2UZM4_CAPBA|nr:hypothetical protein CQW23_34190 [Capsicum baccatum]